MLKNHAILTYHEQAHECPPLSAPRWSRHDNGCTLARSGVGGPWSSQVHLKGYQQTAKKNNNPKTTDEQVIGDLSINKTRVNLRLAFRLGRTSGDFHRTVMAQSIWL